MKHAESDLFLESNYQINTHFDNLNDFYKSIYVCFFDKTKK